MNLQNLPSGSRYGKLIKSCVEAPPGKLFVSSDFNALEDRINTVLTRDPNKEKVYLYGYDSHSLRSLAYFDTRITDVKEVPEDIQETCYHAKVGDTDICFTDNDTVDYKGTKYTGKDFYDLFTNNRL